MTEKELREGVTDYLLRLHVFDYAFLYGEQYVYKNKAWIIWEFERKLKRMSVKEWEKVIKAYIKTLKRDGGLKDGTNDD